MITQSLRGWIDYDRPHLLGLTPSERIDYFELRAKLVAINPLRRILATEIQPTPDSSALLIFGVSLCSAIEATGKFVKGCIQTGGFGVNKARFDEFLKNYMAPDFQSQSIGTDTYGHLLWKHFRNGLSHGFTVRHGGFEGNRGEPYFLLKQVAGHTCLAVNPSLLYDDYVTGFGRYLADLRNAQPGGQKYLDFNMVFNSVFIQGN